MKIIVNRDLCEANARCMEIAPEVFLVNEEDELEILNENPAEEFHDQVEEAVRNCPRAALRIEG